MQGVCACVQDLKGKILLKGKKIGGLEGNLSGVVEDSLGAEMSNEDDPVEIEEANHHNESIRRKTKVTIKIIITAKVMLIQRLSK